MLNDVHSARQVCNEGLHAVGNILPLCKLDLGQCSLITDTGIGALIKLRHLTGACSRCDQV